MLLPHGRKFINGKFSGKQIGPIFLLPFFEHRPTQTCPKSPPDSSPTHSAAAAADSKKRAKKSRWPMAAASVSAPGILSGVSRRSMGEYSSKVFFSTVRTSCHHLPPPPPPPLEKGRRLRRTVGGGGEEGGLLSTHTHSSRTSKGGKAPLIFFFSRQQQQQHRRQQQQQQKMCRRHKEFECSSFSPFPPPAFFFFPPKGPFLPLFSHVGRAWQQKGKKKRKKSFAWHARRGESSPSDVSACSTYVVGRRARLNP